MTGKERKKLIFVAGNQAYKRKVNFVIFMDISVYSLFYMIYNTFKQILTGIHR